MSTSMRSRLYPWTTATLVAACSAGDAGVCGDGILDPEEACDAAGEGCDATCHLTGATAWTVLRDDANAAVDILDVAVGTSGQIVVLGVTRDPSGSQESGSPWLLALDPAGEQRWYTSLAGENLDYPFPPHLAIDADDGIYLQNRGLRRFDPQGRPGWQLPPTDVSLTALAIADGAVLVSGFCASEAAAEATPCLRRHQPATGELVWEQRIDDDGASIVVPAAMTAAGDSVVTLGYRSFLQSDAAEPFVIIVDAVTGMPGASVVGDSAELWTGIGALGSGDLVITGSSELGWFVRRLGPDGEVRWTRALDFHDADGLADLAIGADETIVLVGDDGALKAWQGLIRAFSSDGEPAWALEYPPPSPWGHVTIRGAAFGPGFLVVGGQQFDGVNSPAGLIRKLGPKSMP